MNPPHSVMADTRLKRAIVATGLFVAALWIIQIVGTLAGIPLGVLGVRPGELAGMHGVLTAPLVHGSYTHLLANTPPLLVLGPAMLYGFPRAARLALPNIWLGSGLAVWLFAREAIHLGASGLTYGMLFFVFVVGVLRRDRPSMALAMVVFFLYGGMVWGVLPLDAGISFESHLFGAVTGILAAVLLRHRDPLRPRRPYEWEGEEADDSGEGYVMENLWREADEPGATGPRRPEDP